MATVTVSIGRNVGSVPMSDEAWQNFGHAVGALLGRCSIVYVSAAESRGEWEGIAEDSRTWVAECTEHDAGYVREGLRALAAEFRQDAIALTIGSTELVGA